MGIWVLSGSSERIALFFPRSPFASRLVVPQIQYHPPHLVELLSRLFLEGRRRHLAGIACGHCLTSGIWHCFLSCLLTEARDDVVCRSRRHHEDPLLSPVEKTAAVKPLGWSSEACLFRMEASERQAGSLGHCPRPRRPVGTFPRNKVAALRFYGIRASMFCGSSRRMGSMPRSLEICQDRPKQWHAKSSATRFLICFLPGTLLPPGTLVPLTNFTLFSPSPQLLQIGQPLGPPSLPVPLPLLDFLGLLYDARSLRCLFFLIFSYFLPNPQI